jgi:hypothetical protein
MRRSWDAPSPFPIRPPSLVTLVGAASGAGPWLDRGSPKLQPLFPLYLSLGFSTLRFPRLRFFSSLPLVVARTSLVMGSPIAKSSMLTPRNPFARIILLTIFCLGLFIHTFRPSKLSESYTEQVVHLQQNATEVATSDPFTQAASERVQDCSMNMTHLITLQERYGLMDNIEYARRYINFRPVDVARKSITKVDHDFLPQGFDQIDIHEPPTEATCLEPLELPVPRSPFPKTVDASDLLFGISTTFERLTDKTTGPIMEWAHWLTDGRGNSNGAGLILRLIDASPEQLEATRQVMTQRGIDVKVYASDSSLEMAVRYLSLLPALYNDESAKNRKFLVMCDDDTFFPSMNALLEKLSIYDYDIDQYIGTFSEDVFNIKRHGSQAFGGAGVFFSLPLAEKIAKLFVQCSTKKKVEESNTGWGPQGDILLRKCIYENTEVRLTMLRDLHQLDIQGDPSGFYEAGLFPLSLHHFKGGVWHKARPLAGAQVIHACGEACFLQRFQTADNFIISNGYSVAYYPKGIDFNVHQMERTFVPAPDDFGWNLDFMMGPGRTSLLQTGRKAAWELKEAVLQSDGSVLQTYIRKSNDTRWTFTDGNSKYPMFGKDGVIDLIWAPWSGPTTDS